MLSQDIAASRLARDLRDLCLHSVQALVVRDYLAVRILGIRRRIECALIIPLIIRSVRVLPSGPDQIDALPNVSRWLPSGSIYSDAELLPRNRKVEVPSRDLSAPLRY
jgi:hypothetical protein